MFTDVITGSTTNGTRSTTREHCSEWLLSVIIRRMYQTLYFFQDRRYDVNTLFKQLIKHFCNKLNWFRMKMEDKCTLISIQSVKSGVLLTSHMKLNSKRNSKLET